ncbi:MAG: MATE family efflux transporter [Clostridiales bacterium]|jgi:putative MATE family efflux protein|nr:MATE family efflux transporter [Clostridiales bacterium]
MLKYISRDKTFYKAIIALSGPLVLQNLINNSLSMLDTFMVGRIGEEALAGVALANTVFFVVSLLTFGLQSGSMVLMSQYWGKSDTTTINRILGIAFGLAGAASLIVALAVTFFPERVFSLTSNNQELVRIAADYARIVAFSQFLNSLTLIYIGAQRSIGNTKMGMGVLILSMAANTFLNWVFIFGNLGAPAMGVKGAALATLLARMLEFAAAAAYASRCTRLRLDFRAMIRPGVVIFKDFLRYSAPVAVNETVWGFGFSLYSIIIGHMPNAVAGVAAYTITLTIERLLSAVYFGVGSAASIMVGRPLGAGDREGAHTAGVTILCMTVLFGVVASLAMLAISMFIVIPLVFPLFGASEETMAFGRHMLLIMSIATPFKAFNFCNIVGVLRGGGDVRAGVFLDMGAMYGVALPLGAVAGLALNASVTVVFMLFNLEEIVKLFFGYWRFSQKKWLRNVTREMAPTREGAP